MEREFKITCSVLFVMIMVLTCVLFMYFDRTYEVVFDSNGGCEIASLKVKPGNVIDSVPTPVKEGNIFLGWFVEESEEEYDFSFPINKNLTLKARWQSII